MKEYWIIDVKNVQVIAFKIAGKGSQRITESEVLVGLKFSLLQEAFQRSRQVNHSQVVAWLLSQYE